jgi:hypothetical protein
MNEMTKHGQIGRAAARSGMDRTTARKYVREGKLPSELEQPRTWRTRPDPFDDDWAWVEAQLTAAPGLEAKTLVRGALRAPAGRVRRVSCGRCSAT